jgi:hypothetical protein
MTKFIYSAKNPGATAAVAATVATFTATTSSLATNASEDINYAVAESGILVSFTANRACLVRVYDSATTRAADTRTYNQAVPAAGVTGLIVELEIDPAIAANLDVNVIFANDDAPQSESLYVRVFNLDVPAAITLTLKAVRFVEVVPALSREVLTANRTYYVNTTTGSNSNDGLSLESPFLSATYASQLISKSLDCSLFDVTIEQVGNETAGVVLTPIFGSGKLLFKGSVPGTQIDNVGGLSAVEIWGNGGGVFELQNLVLGNTCDQCLSLNNGATINTLDNIEYKNGKFGILCLTGCRLSAKKNFSFSGNRWIYPVYCIDADITFHTINPAPGAITLASGSAWSGYYFIYCERGYVRLYNSAYVTFSGSGTGGRIRCDYDGKVIRGNVAVPGSGDLLQNGGAVY